MTWDTADTRLGSRTVAALGPGLTNVVTTTLHIPLSTAAGSYYVLAKADWEGVVNESVETNNVRASGLVKIGPDLTVSAASAPASAAAGATITVTDTTNNVGGGVASPSTTRFYWSANATLDGNDQVLANRAVPVIAAGGASANVNTSVTIPANAAAGTYYVIAQADAAVEVGETTETNNTRATGTIKVGPDLVVSAITISSNAAPGGTISVSDTTKNQGGATADTSSTGFYLSANQTIDPTDRFLGSRPVGELGPNGTAPASTTLLIPADTLPGSYFIIGRADWSTSVAETSETNNDRSTGSFKVGGDLIVSAVSGPATAMANGPITVTDSTRNQGAGAAPESVTGFYLSPNSKYEPTDDFLGSRVVQALGPSATSTSSTPLVIPAGKAPGVYYVIAVADIGGAVAESLENNNAKNSAGIRIGPDFTVTSLTSPSSVVAGTSLSVTDTTKNQGGDIAPASGTSFHLSTNSTLDAGDQFLGTRDVLSLGPGLSQTGSVMLPIPTSTAAGTYYIIAKSDGGDVIAEAQETNNTRARSISIVAAPPP
jgi:subtilase family serine protease